MSHRFSVISRILVCVLLLCCVVAPATAVFRDGSFDPDPPGEEPGGSDDDDRPSGDDDNGSGGPSDGPPTGEPDPNIPSDEEIAAGIEGATRRILDALAAAARRVAGADLRMRNILNREGYASILSGADASVSFASNRAYLSRASLDSILRSSADAWEQQRSAAARTRTDLERELAISRSPDRGDPVRIVDGAYISMLPLPVLRSGTISIDLSLRYDSRRTLRGTWGSGWSDPMEERLIRGGLTPPALDGAYRTALEESTDRAAAVIALLREILAAPDTPVTVHISAIDAVLAEQDGALREIDEQRTLALRLLPSAEYYGVATGSLRSALAGLAELRSRTQTDRAVASAARRVLVACRDSGNEISAVITEIEALRSELHSAREEYSETRRANRETLYPGGRTDLMETGYDHCTYIDETGAYHLFRRDDSTGVYRSDTLPYVDLSSGEAGWSLSRPDGVTRTFDSAGRISGITDRDGYGFGIIRENTDALRVVQIRNSAGEPVATYRVSRTGEISLSVATVAETRFSVIDGTLRSADGPRGRVEYGYAPAGLSSIRRADGTRTLIEYAGSEVPSPVVSVTYPSGSTEHFAYPSATRRVYRDPDGVETVLSVRDNRVISVTDASGYRREFIRDSSGDLVEIRDNRGDRETRRYDERGALLQQQFTDGSWLRLTRNRRGEAIAMESDAGTVWSATRDETGRITSVVTPEDTFRIETGSSGRRIISHRGGVWRVTPDPAGHPVTIARGDGVVDRFEYDVLGRVTARFRNGEEVERFEYDDAGRLGGGVRQGRRYEYRYDNTGRTRTRIVDGAVLDYTAFDTGNRPILRRYHDGTEERYAYTAAGRLLEFRSRSDELFRYEYNPAGMITAVVAAGTDERWEFRYDPTGRRTVQITPDGSHFEALYGTDDRIVGTRFPDGSVEYEHPLPGGRVREVDRLGGSTMYRYDAAGRPVRVLRDDGRDLRFVYDGGTTLCTINGDEYRTTLYDPYGRVLEKRFPDGTTETFRYGETLLPISRRDRRGGEERWEWDRYDRCTRHVFADGREERWRYGPAETVYYSPEGTVSRTTFDAEGRVLSTHHGSVRREYRYLPGGFLEISVDGETEERRFRDVGSRLLGIPEDAALPGAPDSSVHRIAPGRWSGIEGGTYREIGLHWSGAVRTVTEGTAPTTRRWTGILDPYGRPSEVTTPEGREFRFEWSRDGDLAARTTPGGTVRRNLYDETGALRGWTGSTGTVTIDRDVTSRDIAARSGAESLRYTLDPYGALRTEERRGFGSGHTTTWERDITGRAIRIASSVVSVPLEIADSTAGETIRAGSFTVTIRSPAGHSDGSGRSHPSIELSSEDDGTRHVLEFDTDEIRYDNGTVRVRQSGTESAITVQLRSGFTDLADAIVYLRDSSNRVVAEQNLAGELHAYRYDQYGRLSAVETTVTAGIRRAATIAATGIDRAALAGLWRGLVPTGAIPAAPLRFERHEIRRNGDGRIVSSDAVEPIEELDGHGRAVGIAGTTFEYDPFTDVVRSIASDTTVWTIERRGDGSPARFSDVATPWNYGSIEHVTTMGSETVSVRLWERTRDPGRSAAVSGGTDPVTAPGRYYGAPSGNDEGVVDDPNWSGTPGVTSGGSGDPRSGTDGTVTRALEIRVNDRPVAFLTDTGLVVPFCDIRGTIRGLYRSDAEHPMPRYTPHPDTQLPLTAGTPVAVTTAAVHRLPAAIPYDTVISGLDHLPETGVLLSRNRSVSLATGAFTTLDPDLNGYSWYEYAGGDPINYQDTTGRYVVGIDAGHFQQDPLWARDPLGSSENYTIGQAGCKLVTVSNAINQIAGDEIVNPGRLNRALTDGYYRNGSLLDSNDVADVIAGVTRHEVAYVPIHPDQVDIERVIEAIADDPATRYVVSARIETGGVGGSRARRYEHSLNVSGFDSAGRPIFQDTSNRNRTSLGEDERVLRYDVYATSRCRVY